MFFNKLLLLLLDNSRQNERIIHNLNQLDMKVSEIKQNVDTAVAKLQKARDEILKAIKALKDSLTNQDLPQEATDALAALDSEAAVLDDIVPDSPSPPVE